MAKVTITGVVFRVSQLEGWYGPYRRISIVSDTCDKTWYWFSDNSSSVSGLRVGHRGTVTGSPAWHNDGPRLLRPTTFEHDTSPVPKNFLSDEGLALIRWAHSDPGDPVRRLAIADWLSDQFPVWRSLGQVIGDSLDLGGFILIPSEFRSLASPFSGAWNGWPIGRSPNRHQSDPDLTGEGWLDWEAYRAEHRRQFARMRSDLSEKYQLEKLGTCDH